METRERREQIRAWRSRLRVLEAALDLFADRGYEHTTIKDVATRADVSVGLACRYFATKEHLALALYKRLADDLAARAADLPAGTMAERFAAAMRVKLALLEPHRRALMALAGKALDPEARTGVLSDATEPVRAEVLGVFALAVRGANDAPADDARAWQLARSFYALHLAFVVLWLQSAQGQLGALGSLADDAGNWVTMFAAIAPPDLIERIHSVLGERIAPKGDVDDRARAILRCVFRRRRVLPGVDAAPSEAALALHLPRALAFVERDAPVQLVLPAFPAKSPNAKKVLSPRPDAAEELALRGLSELLDEIANIHPPGAELVVCSDGHVFADLVHVKDADVDRYRADLESAIAELGDERLRVFDLRDAFGDAGPVRARALLLERYAQSLEAIHERADHGERHRAQIDGIHRFLVEDEAARRPDATKSQIKKDTRAAAYEVVRRSDAWSRLVATAFPRALRLSIHPQPDVSEKIGVHLLATRDAWLTPWHACAVLRGDHYELMHRADAEALGAVVVEEDGRPRYLEVPS